MNDLEILKNLVLAPYLLKAMALINISRRVGGNQFRHSFATLGILFDYHVINDPVLLKASLLHDLFEELPEIQIDEVRWIDEDGPKVVELVLENTRHKDETKAQYLQRIRDHCSINAKLLKCADRISNLTDLNRDSSDPKKIEAYLKQTEEYIIPMAKEVNPFMEIELKDLVARRRILLRNSNRQLIRISEYLNNKLMRKKK